MLLMTPLAAHALSTAPTLNVEPLYILNMQGDRITTPEVGQQVMLTTTFSNNVEKEITYVGIIDVRNSGGISVILDWQSNVVKPDSNKTVGVSWVIEDPSTSQQPSKAYRLRAFAVTDFEQPQVLSIVSESEITVK